MSQPAKSFAASSAAAQDSITPSQPEQMRISVVVPVRDEEETIRVLLDGLLAQSRPPDEIVITDGGSKDATVRIIEGYIQKGVPLRLVRTDGALPGRGRNLAAAQAACEWIAFTDAGICPAQDWLSALASRVEQDGEADVVYGSFEPLTDSLFKECAAIAYVPPPVLMYGAWMRTRSIASALMRREVWRTVGGFPEHLRSAEDLLFMNRIEEANFNIAYEPRALVRWNIQPTLWRTFKRFITYSRNNIRAGLWNQWQAAIFRRYGMLLLTTLPAFLIGPRWLLLTLACWLLLLLMRSVVALRRNRLCYPAGLGRNILRLLVLVPLIMTLDAAAIIGSIQWFLKDKMHPESVSENRLATEAQRQREGRK